VRGMRFITLASLTLAAAFGQPAFEVASVKPTAGNPRGRDIRLTPGRLVVTNQPLDILVREAYHLQPYQIVRSPAWFSTDRFDITATAADDPSREQMMRMLQALLKDRFHLKVHRETREGKVYALVVVKSGSKLKEPAGSDPPRIGVYRMDPPERPSLTYVCVGSRVPVSSLAERLSADLQAPVLDRTGIEGDRDFRLEFAPDDPAATGPSIFAAIQEQLGLKLDTTKGPIETLVIDHAEKPSGN